MACIHPGRGASLDRQQAYERCIKEQNARGYLAALPFLSPERRDELLPVVLAIPPAGRVAPTHTLQFQESLTLAERRAYVVWGSQRSGGSWLGDAIRGFFDAYTFGAVSAVERSNEAERAESYRDSLARLNAMEQSSIPAPAINGATKAAAPPAGAAPAIAPAMNGMNGAEPVVLLGAVALVAWLFLKG